ncbi:MAG: B12-binding domain-containing radical SAM protein [Spirochaetales bacterium]|uniref:B12-binding domain-containing radical SAM protein n=1 Tax=Candidatus Thalassospirochaeta sargassi TaxID=3119039 RepID=A0AAJ1IFN1_9SPIO|nr:B12-binding domain-containing radical SAM protein [Spirochaetales bacterium]
MTISIISIHVEETPPAFPLAAAILKAATKADPRTSDSDVRLIEYYLPVSAYAAARELAESGTDACCFPAYTWNASAIINIASAIRAMNPSIRLITGGPQASADHSQFLNAECFDAVIRGEGERAIVDALTAESCSGNQTTQLIDAPAADFESSPSPYPAAADVIKKHSGILWEVSRGCPYSCAFCYESRGSKTVRTIPENKMRAELHIFRENEIKKIWVLDPTFNYNHGHAEKVLARIAEIYPEAHYTFEIRAELMTEKLCSMMSELNISLQIGLQTINPDAGKIVNRRLSRKKFQNNCRMMSEYGLSFGIDLIYGLPADNYNSFRESLDFAVKAVPNNIDIFPLSVLPGTEISERKEELNLKEIGFPEYQIISNTSFSAEDIALAAKLTEAVDQFYNKEQAFPWFNAVTEAMELTPSELFEAFNRHRNLNVLDFIRAEFYSNGRQKLFPVIESFILWSRTAEQAFANPGREFPVKLCRRPEILDELSGCSPEAFLKRHPNGREKTYTIFFDGEELYIN